MPTFTSTVDIAAPQQQVWEVLTDILRWGDWMPGVKKVTTETEAGGVGAVYTLDQGVLGGSQRYRLETLQAPELVEYSTSGTTATRAGYRLTALDTGATRAECTYDLGGALGAPVGAVLGGTFQKTLDGEMKALKERCESGA